MGGRKRPSTFNPIPADGIRAKPPGYEEMKADRQVALDQLDDVVVAKHGAEQLTVELREQGSWLRGQKEAFQATINDGTSARN